MQNIDYSEIRSFKDLRKNSFFTATEKENQETPYKIKKKADKAFGEGKFTKAYGFYNELLLIKPKDYDILACQIGTALNLGYLDEVFTKSELLIELDPHKAQGYYLKGIANDILFNFENAIELFLKALEYEKDHSKLIVKNLTKTIAKLINANDLFQLEETDDEPDTTYLLKLIEITDLVIKKRKLVLASKILNYIESLDAKNYLVKTEFLLTSGNLFKNAQTLDKAFLALEECFYLANLNEDYKLKVKSLVSISACYLVNSDLHKVIFYYHKILDIESDLMFKNHSKKVANLQHMQFNDDVINLEMRIAIRQNLFTAHYRLGKLRLCCYYLNQMILVIDNQLDLSSPEKVNDVLNDMFEYVQIKIDASLELSKFYILFKEFAKLEVLLNSMISYVEDIIKNVQGEHQLLEKPYINLVYFKIKCYSLMGICQSGLREFRFSKLCTRKCFVLLEKQMKQNLDEATGPLTSVSQSTFNIMSVGNTRELTLLKVECLSNAAEAANQMIKTFKEMKQLDFRLLPEDENEKDGFSKAEISGVIQAYEERIDYAKQAYMLSKSLIDPNLRAQVTFEFAMSLYENELYQSAGYYFNEILSISTILLDSTKPQEEHSDFLTDIKPDYHLESNVYFIKCQLLINYYQSESCIATTDVDGKDLNEQEASEKRVITEGEQMKTFYNKLTKANELITTAILKWKLTETNRASFKFNSEFYQAEKEKLKEDTDCNRLKYLLNICTECLTYVAFKLSKLDDCLFYIEHNKYLLSMDINDLKSRLLIGQSKEDLVKLLEAQTLNLIENIEEMRRVQKKINDPLIIYKTVFDAKLLYVFYTESNGAITLAEKVKLSLVFNKNKITVDSEQKKLNNNSELDFFLRKFEKSQNDWVKQHLSGIECRDLSANEVELKRLRVLSRAKEQRLYEHLNGIKTDKSEGVALSKDLIENSQERFNRAKRQLTVSDRKTLTSNSSTSSNLGDVDYMLKYVLYPIFLTPISQLLNYDVNVNIMVDSVYAKLVMFTINDHNSRQEIHASKIFYNLVLDSFLLSAVPTLSGDINEKQEIMDIKHTCHEIKNNPRQKNDDKETTVKLLKSSVIPRYTSHPRLAISLLNEEPDSDYITVRNDHLDRARSRMNAAIGTLISDTYSGTDAKHSNLEVIDYKQIYKQEKCCVIGCPDVPKVFLAKTGIEKFLKNGFNQLCKLAKLLHTNPIFSSEVTKQELLNQLNTSKVIFLSTMSSNESDSSLICAETSEYPSCVYEIDKYCKLKIPDLNLIHMDQCYLLILNCYSGVNHVPRIELARKFLARGCKNVLLVMSPLTDEMMTQFYSFLFESLKVEEYVTKAYHNAIQNLIKAATEKHQSDNKAPISALTLQNAINSAFCLIGSKQIKLSINSIAKKMVQCNIDSTLNGLQADKNHLNVDHPLSILSGNFKPWLEKTLIDLQILFKFAMHQLIIDTPSNQGFKTNESHRSVCYYLYDLVSKAIFYIKNKKIEPEQLSELVMNNRNAENILVSLGFNMQRTTVDSVRDMPEKKFIAFPDNRFLDLNMRTVHVLSALIELCFEQSIENQTKPSDFAIHLDEVSYMNQFFSKSPDSMNEKIELRTKAIVFNLQALLPIEDKNLLTCLIDIIALTKFSSEIVLALTDHSVYYAFNYYEKNSTTNSKEFNNLLNKDIDNWFRKNSPDESPKKTPNFILTPGTNHAVKFTPTNKVVNFLFSIGFEIVGDWLRFNDIEYNRRIIELMLKFFTSFAIDRDMSLYKELNINVMGQRSAVTRERYSMIRSHSTTPNRLVERNVDHFKTLVAKPWCSIIESNKEMLIKLDFIKNFIDLSKQLSYQRTYALKQYLNYTLKQHNLNLQMNQSKEEEESEKSNSGQRKVKFKPGGGPAKDRIMINEKYELTHEQINQIRKLSFLFCQKSILQIDVDLKEKSQKLMLPLIKAKVHNL